MTNKRLLDILAMLGRDDVEDQQGSTLCSVAAEFTELSGAGITIVSDGPNYSTYCASDDVARDLLDLEVVVGEGPGIDACGSDYVIDEADLRSHRDGRWMAYAPAAADIGARAVFGFPVRIGAIRIGALTFYRNRPGPLSELQESDAYILATVVAREVLGTRAGAPRHELASELGLGLSLDFSVHQAAGMVAIQGEMDLSDAMVTLRAHAFGSGMSMTDVAQRVVRRETIYDPVARDWVAQEAGNLD
jgi:hypothetical protein